MYIPTGLYVCLDVPGFNSQPLLIRGLGNGDWNPLKKLGPTDLKSKEGSIVDPRVSPESKNYHSCF